MRISSEIYPSLCKNQKSMSSKVISRENVYSKKEKECSFRCHLAPLHMSLLGGEKNVNLLLFFTQDIFYELLENPIRYRFHDMTSWLNNIISTLIE